MHILVVEADGQRATALATAMRRHGCVVDVAGTAEDGSWLATEGGFDALVINRHLPDGDGVALCAGLREGGSWVPVLIVGHRGAAQDRIAALDAGADDCVLGRVSGPELCARLRAVVRRGQPPRPAVITVGTLGLDPATQHVSVGGHRLLLGGRARAILELLMRHAGEVVSRDDIAAHTWDWAWEARSNVIAVHIHEIRLALAGVPGAPTVETVRASGFRLVAAAATAAAATADAAVAIAGAAAGAPGRPVPMCPRGRSVPVGRVCVTLV